jgi:hypothetical protein
MFAGVGASDADFQALGVPLLDPLNAQIKRVHFAGEFTSLKYRGTLRCYPIFLTFCRLV